ncbi:winged helix-turn-helix domain-containing protein [Tahibacter harae]|uniref:Winged helix-turn-helix domain-containing protein n=1 Tax=Tahibacter harae TaxID=2963937 RepID=A0ABT1QRF1_9GAMM|nr:winged helix-turn-helix domain-containing protein [Tahibacter harae]MCQ4164883.1 winged helix-turn-helix domain-containing protein [Tahibacter harae]
MQAMARPQAGDSVRYRFADVVIEPQGRRIFVGQRERAASRRAFDLLLTLCAMPGRVLTRDELSARLWPGGQIVSDEALTQAIFRARAVLGAQGERIVTLRGVGIRFDAEVICEPAPLPGVVMAGSAEVVGEAALAAAGRVNGEAAAAASVSINGEAAPISAPMAAVPVSTPAAASVPVGAPAAVSPAAPAVAAAQAIAAGSGVAPASPAATAPPAASVPSQNPASVPVATISAATAAAQPALADRSAAATAPTPTATQPAPAEAQPFRSRRRRFAIAALLLLVLAVFTILPLLRGDAGLIDEGYGIGQADLHAAHADSAHLLAEAVRHDNNGDRPRGRAVLETLADSDPRTPWPPLILALWSVGAGDTGNADIWLARARERAAPLQDTYVNAMLRYTEAERSGNPQDIIRYAGAVLDLRPQAWRMHLARAHLKNYQGLREAALAEIRQIEIRALGNRKLEMALADRAAFGDVAGAQAVLDSLPRGSDEAAYAYLSGRIAWSRRDLAAAQRDWERAAGLAQRDGRSDIGNRSYANAGLAAMLQGDHAAAIAQFERARVGMVEARWVTDEIDLSLLLTQLHAVDGDMAGARREFQRAVAAAGRTGASKLTGLVVLIGARLLPDIDTAAVPQEELDVAPALLAARLALNRGDRATAKRELELARQRGALEAAYADEARLLAAELGQTVAPERALDPPYPPLAAAAARLELTARTGAAHKSH